MKKRTIFVVAAVAFALVAAFVFIPGPSILASVYAGNAQKNVEKGDYDKAIEDWTKAIRLRSDDAEGYKGRAFAYEAKGDYDKAIEDWTKAIRLRPDYAEYYEFRAHVYYYEKGDINRAIADYTEFARLAPRYISDIFEHAPSGDGKGVAITGYNGGWSMVVIPSVIDGMPVTEIGEEAFKGNSEISFVALPAGVVSISYRAFTSCQNLTGVAFANGLQVLGDYCFADTKLSTVQLPDSVRELGISCFASCTSLTAINLPASLAKIGAYAFVNCRELTNLAIPDGLSGVYFSEAAGWGAKLAESIMELLSSNEGRPESSANARTFEGCAKLPSQTRSRLRQLGYRGVF